jgi:hypothetical protein
MKVYIAKSNNANPDYLIKVRHFLSKFKTIEVFEYLGKKYNNQDLIDSDLLIVIPDLSEGIQDGLVNLGKGLYTQIEDFISNQSIDWCFIITGVNDKGDLVYSPIKEVDEYGDYDKDFMSVYNENDFVDYGLVKVDEENGSVRLFSLLAELILIDDRVIEHPNYSQKDADKLWTEYVTNANSEGSSGKYRYLLIGN